MEISNYDFVANRRTQRVKNSRVFREIIQLKSIHFFKVKWKTSILSLIHEKDNAWALVCTFPFIFHYIDIGPKLIIMDIRYNHSERSLNQSKFRIPKISMLNPYQSVNKFQHAHAVQSKNFDGFLGQTKGGTTFNSSNWTRI